MRKIFVTILLVAGIAFTSNAQTRPMFVGAGVVVSLPMGDFGDQSKLGIGGTAAFEMEFMPQLVGTVQAGYISWGAKDEAESSEGGFNVSASASVSAVPVMVGGKYYFMPDMGLYGAAQLGLYFVSADAEVESNIPGLGSFDVGGGSSTEFAFKIGGGYEIPVSPKFNVDLSAAFVLISDFTNIEFRAGGKFAL